MFIGREKEIAVLNEIYDKPGFQMTVIYGRRRIGKSKLITEFIKGKRASYYVASKTSLEDNVRKWSRQFIEDTAPRILLKLTGHFYRDFRLRSIRFLQTEMYI